MKKNIIKLILAEIRDISFGKPGHMYLKYPRMKPVFGYM